MNVVFLGSPKSGKTSIIRQLMSGTFDHRYKATVEESFNFVVQQPDGMCCVLNVFDTSGTDEFPVMRDLRIKQSAIVVIVYSVTCKASFDYAVRMCKTARKVKEDERVPIVLVGNRIDLTSERVVTYDDGYKMMQDISTCYFVETSARHDDNITRIVDIVLLQKDVKRDQENLKRRLSLLKSANLVTDRSVSTLSQSDINTVDLWLTPTLKRKRNKRCCIM